MAIKSCKEFRESTADYASSEKGNSRTYTRTWLLVSDTPNDGQLFIISSWSGITGIVEGDFYNTGYEYDEGSFFQHVSCRREAEDGLNWLVTAEYKPYPDGGQDDNPIHQPAEITWSFQAYQKVCDKTTDNKSVVNSAGDPFNNPVLIDQGRPVLTIRQNESSFDATTAAQYVDTINSNSFQGCDPATVKCQTIGGQRIFNQKYGYYWAVSYEFQFRPETWDVVVLDAGFRTLAAGVLKNVLVQGVPITQPILLDGNGSKLTAGANPHWLTFKVYQRVPFNFSFRT